MMDGGGSVGPVDLSIHRLRARYEVLSPLLLPAHSGTSIRGALVESLRGRFCALLGNEANPACGTQPGCQVCGLLATQNAQNDRGREIPRPFILRPPVGSQVSYRAGDELAFDLALLGGALRYTPYLAVALQAMRLLGRGEEGPRGGRIALRDVWALNDLSGDARRIARGDGAAVELPGLPIGRAQIEARAASLPEDAVTLRLRTPLRLTLDGQPVRQLSFGVLVRRIIGRLSDLSAHYGGASRLFLPPTLLGRADSVAVRADTTRWVDVESPSSRLQRTTPVGGLIGEICFAGDLRPYMPLLVWAEQVHLGKDTTKGNGWIEIV